MLYSCEYYGTMRLHLFPKGGYRPSEHKLSGSGVSALSYSTRLLATRGKGSSRPRGGGRITAELPLKRQSKEGP